MYPVESDSLQLFYRRGSDSPLFQDKINFWEPHRHGQANFIILFQGIQYILPKLAVHYQLRKT